MNVLSLFDGMSCGRLALEKAGVEVDTYFASEIDKHAMKVSSSNYPDIVQIGDVCKIKAMSLPKIDLLLGGSPCQGFSLAGKQLAFNDPRSILYFQYERLLKELTKINPNMKFLLENVKMKQEHKDFITTRLGVAPVAINSSLVSAQNRFRLYWANFEITQPTDRGLVLSDVLEDTVDIKYFVKAGRLSWLQRFGEIKEKDGYVSFNPNKAKCLTARGEPSWNTTYILQWPRGTNAGGVRAKDGKTPSLTTSSWPANNLLLNNGFVRKLTPRECERLQTVPDDFTATVSDAQRYRMLGNGWTVDVIAHIFKGLVQ